MKLSTRHRLWQFIFGAMIVLFFLALNVFNVMEKENPLHRLSQMEYDLRLKMSPKPSVGSSVVIVDINNQSLKEIGRWPWSRVLMGDLLKRISDDGAIVIALDIVMSEKEFNAAQQLKNQIVSEGTITPEFIKQLSNLPDPVGSDEFFKEQLGAIKSKTSIVFGYPFVAGDGSPGPSEAYLPALLNISGDDSPENSSILSYPSFIPNLLIFREAVSSQGFLSVRPDTDNTIRKAPLLNRYAGKLYASLPLEAVLQYNAGRNDPIVLQFNKQNTSQLSSIQLMNKEIHTDGSGQVFIPYRGVSDYKEQARKSEEERLTNRKEPLKNPEHQFKYISALAVLNGHVPQGTFTNKLVFIGSTADALGDKQSTPIGPGFPGVEVHASIADALMNDKETIPYRPEGASGVELFVTLVLGMILVILMPFLGVLSLLFVSIFSQAGMIYFEVMAWRDQGIAYTMILPILMVFCLFMFHMGYGFLFEYRTKKRIKQMFGEYVPPAIVERMSETPSLYGFEGESRSMTVLFADIRGFTSLSEKLSASEVKRLLNDYFTPITKIIFDHGGTVDKYVGDMVVAFWNAPMPRVDHAVQAVLTGLAMLKELERLKPEFEARGLPSFDIGIGVNTGVMNVGDMGSKYRKAYTVLGDAVNLASRLESLTKTYQVGLIVSEFTKEEIQKTRQDLVFKELDRVLVKGKEQPVTIYEVSLLSGPTVI